MKPDRGTHAADDRFSPRRDGGDFKIQAAEATFDTALPLTFV